MHHVPVTIDRETAKDLWKAYQLDRNRATPMDREISRAYSALAAGKLVIKALESIATAGLDDDGLPKLAIARADAKVCHLTMRGNGTAVMSTAKRMPSPRRGQTMTTRFDWPANTFPKATQWRDAEAIVPLIPPRLRPKRKLQAYHIMWEANWRRAPPVDPFLLRRLGAGDLFLVCGIWDLTEVERAALAARL